MPRGRRLTGLVLAAASVTLGSPALALDASPVASPEPIEIVIAGPDEPGQPLRVEGRVVDALTSEPVAEAHLVVYHTDDEGEYEEADPLDESTARLRGEMTTGPDGRFALRTILPGEYPDTPLGNRHVHVHSVTAEGYLPRGFVILFDDNVRDEVRAWAGDTGFGEIIETRVVDGVLHGSLEIRLEPLAEEASAAPPA